VIENSVIDVQDGFRQLVKAAQLQHDVGACKRDNQKDREIADGETGK
jgi:hypothetical protein